MSRTRALRSLVLFDVHRRRHPVWVLLAVVACEFSFLFLVRQLGPPRKFVGIPGAGAVIIALAAATLEGPVVGALAVVVAGVAFTVITAGLGSDVELLTVVYSVLLWLVATVVAGVAAETARQQIRDRESDLSLALSAAESSRDAIQSLLDLGPVFYCAERGEGLEERICEAARATFGTASVWLLDYRHETLQVMAATADLQLEDTHALSTEGLGSFSPYSSSFVVHWSGAESEPVWLGELIRPLGVRSASVTPIMVEGLTTHLLVVGWETYRAALVPAEEALLRSFADQVALALGRAEVDRLHARLEANLLPEVPITHPTLRVETRYLPGERRLGLGGDFFDFLPIFGTGAAFLIGDVSGHDVDSAATGALLRATWRALTLAGEPLDQVMRVMARALGLETRGSALYATVLAGVVAPGGHEVTFVNFGHPPPLLLSGDARAILLPPALPLGFWEEDNPPATTVALPSEWMLFLYTDGLIEGFAQPGSRERFGVDRLLRSLDGRGAFGDRAETGAHAGNGGRRQVPDLPVGLDRLLDVVHSANGAPLPDDVAILVVRGEAGSAAVA